MANSRTGVFPIGNFVPQPHLCLRIFDDDNDLRYGTNKDDITGDSPISIPRLRSNLEVVWDSVLSLHRRFRGDMTGFAPGVLKSVEATRAMTALHAANCDAFACRLVSLISSSAREPGHTPDRLRQLESRLHSNQKQMHMDAYRQSNASVNSTPGTPGGGHPSDSDKESVGGVTLHRAPRLVRDSFAREHAQHLFFLDFIIGADSARLCTALIPRLASEVCDSIIRASRATSAAAFTDAVLEARLYAKLLCTVLHLPNWAHSSAALSGASGSTVPAMGAPLSKRVLAARAALHGVMCEAIINIGDLVDDAIACRQPTAITVTVAVVADFIRFSVLDPVARDTAWFQRGIAALCRSLRVSPSLKHIVETHVPANELSKHEKKDNMANDDSPIDRQTETNAQPFNLTNSAHNDVQSRSDAYMSLFMDSRLMRAVNPSAEGKKSKSASHKSNKPERSKQPSAVRRITPIVQESGSDLVMKDTDAERYGAKTRGKGKKGNAAGGTGDRTEKESNGEIRDDGDESNGDDEGDTDDEEKPSGIDEQLQREFFARTDGRVRELVSIVAAAGDESSLPSHDAFLNIVNVLYPKTPVTVAAVAAEICAKRDRRSRSRSSPKSNSNLDRQEKMANKLPRDDRQDRPTQILSPFQSAQVTQVAQQSTFQSSQISVAQANHQWVTTRMIPQRLDSTAQNQPWLEPTPFQASQNQQAPQAHQHWIPSHNTPVTPYPASQADQLRLPAHSMSALEKRMTRAIPQRTTRPWGLQNPPSEG